MQQRQSPAIMIISVQSPANSAPIIGVADGNSGLYIQDVTHGGIAKLHRNFRLKDQKEQEIFVRHLQADGWLVITGHGNAGTEQISGNYVARAFDQDHESEADAQAEVMDIACSAKDFANLVMSANCLKSGATLNILLSVCYAAKPGVKQEGGSASTKSFAEQLGDEFAARNIHTCIVASMNSVGRVGGYLQKEGELPGKKLRFRTEKDAIRIFYRNHTKSRPFVLAPNEDFYMTPSRIGCGQQLKLPLVLRQEYIQSDARLLDAVLHEDPPVETGLLTKYFSAVTNDEQCKAVLLEHGGIIIRKSSSSMNTITLSYVKSLEPLVLNHRQFNCSEDGKGGLKIDRADLFNQCIRRYSVKHATHVGSGSIVKAGLMWKNPDINRKTNPERNEPRREPGNNK